MSKRDPGDDAVAIGDEGPVYSVAVPGVMRGDMARLQLVGSRAFVEVQHVAGDDVEMVRTSVIELTIAELRVLVTSAARWPLGVA